MMSIPDKRTKLAGILALAPVIPVITIEDAAQAVPLARALIAGGLRVIEITLRTQAGLDAARAIIEEVPDAVVGIGTVLTPADYDRAARLGAAFAISPGLSIDLLDAANEGELPFAPGVQTPSDLIACVTRGYELVKFFPAMPAGGLAALDALGGPFPTVRFCPTGGINAGNAAQWLAHKKVVALGGSWIAPAADITAGAWSAIEQRARAAAALR
ncbi:MAG: bifunctional 4-hydroxy-2-oxoglutarate aldolase/2-dehydro-3-deoxy-phosphogluconate aldolase [Bradyrhizobium sp.]|jgi:2-dehydro-3-deoxyphosphogluconate aldolase/(4S)-4-hydroxy-2-oxoglutarate aldolase|uniref:2-dehydro-3-deoxy-phosphogluconate aldolase n=3 Tax=Bradyrhizobium TaxID=374 RepID=A0ABS5G2R1_9BRAD|nr:MULTISPECIES: bifunctional 4-hydroxy-2-oxoglutarate aldolase/2-dehydro-3-deoxy-phosphogluconate aldolase [Bradyrhizobium]RTL93391.1 MAG: bifunctional 4-hydroxy-2-oxoglutarate aldolase/2-dehydro-3-deoxy-phosphogluconate aldolase [Bradyrhizobiaceae bacterium]ABQ34313.1 2-keto-3-deoxy-phosphogluconate aldolase [Bradyrhizobium sp. BTAi1]MBR1135603.1 bifunctional 4-hydroxy-2-oxoglutarate aldolase/2-dehydro-3-deoxy-phosphogluconate aldolase [Bradyrhizobium denitrificans]MCL8482608.1 bifunctional 4